MSDSMFEIVEKTETPDESKSKASKSKASKHDPKPESNHKSAPGKIDTRLKNIFGKIAQYLMSIYVLFYLAVFPLCIHDRYFDILVFRFRLFWKPTLAYGIIFALLGLFFLLADQLYNSGSIRRNFMGSLKNKGWKKYISSTDIAFTSLILIFSLSTALAEYPYEAFWGNRGRWQGLLIWLMFYIAYILITRFYKYKKWHIYAFMIGASIVCIWGICNFFLMTFGMFEGANEKFKYIFVSSIGNINNYCNFTGIFYGASVVMFVLSEKPWETVLTYLFIVIAGFAQIMGLSDSAVLSTGIVFAATPLFIIKNRTHIVRFFIVVSTYLAAMKITSLITQSGIETMNDPDPSLQITIAGKGNFSVALITILVITVMVAVCVKLKEKAKNHDMPKKFRLFWKLSLASGACVLAIILLCANMGWHENLWEPYKGFLVFNDQWGTGRGLAWRLGMEYWLKDSTLLSKLIGYGPDTYYIITMDRFMNIMRDAGYGMFDSAHNEYFEYFITVGIFGLITYIAVLYTSIKGMFNCHEAGFRAAAMGVLAYSFQAVVNIAIPITTPVFMVLLFLGAAGSRQNQGIK